MGTASFLFENMYTHCCFCRCYLVQFTGVRSVLLKEANVISHEYGTFYILHLLFLSMYCVCDENRKSPNRCHTNRDMGIRENIIIPSSKYLEGEIDENRKVLIGIILKDIYIYTYGAH